MIDLEDKTVAALTEQQRKSIKCACLPCKPESVEAPCVLACAEKAIWRVWKPQ